MKKITVLILLLVSIFACSIQVNASSTGITGPDVIHKQYNHILTISDIIGVYSSELGQIQIMEDNYTGYGNILGSHGITLAASDGTTTATKTVEILVVAELGNVTCVANYKDIHLKTNQILTPSQIVYVLEKTGYIEITASTQMMILSNSYTENAEIEGQYLFEFRLVNSAGIDAVYSSIINVSDDENLFIPDITFVPEASFLSKAWDTILFFLYLAIFLAFIYYAAKAFKKLRGKKAYS